MMLGEHQLGLDFDVAHAPRELVAQDVLLEQLLARPYRDGFGERAESARRKGQIGLQQALELEERFVVEDDVIEFLDREAASREAVIDGSGGKIGIVPFAREALFLGRRN